MTEAESMLIETMKRVSPGFYTERDGGAWYVVTPDGSRLAEDFENRNDARKLICWLGGEDMPKRWRIEPHGDGDLSFDIEIPGRSRATIWVRETRKLFPIRWAEVEAAARPTVASPSNFSR